MGKGRDKRKKAAQKQKVKQASQEQLDRLKSKARALKEEQAADAEAPKASKSKGAAKAAKSRDAELRELEALISDIQKATGNGSVAMTPCGPPSPRLNCSLTAVSNDEVILFGGEFYDGNPVNTFVYNELFRWHLGRHEWTQVATVNTPPPRCSHQCTLFRDSLYLFGGEFCTTDKFHHYRDLWRLDLKSHTWEQLAAPGGPSARSGHRMALWRNNLVVFGGFYEAFRESQWFNDLYIFSTQTEAWRKVQFAPTAAVPAVRSGFQMVVYNDTLLVNGGYTKLKTSSNKDEVKVHRDMWAINLAALLTTETATVSWERVSRKGQAPGERSGAAMVLYKHRALHFGGVEDVVSTANKQVKGQNTKVSTEASTFFNDLHVFDMEHRRWYEMPMREPDGGAAGSGAGASSGARRRRRPRENQAENKPDQGRRGAGGEPRSAAGLAAVGREMAERDDRAGESDDLARAGGDEHEEHQDQTQKRPGEEAATQDTPAAAAGGHAPWLPSSSFRLACLGHNADPSVDETKEAEAVSNAAAAYRARDVEDGWMFSADRAVPPAGSSGAGTHTHESGSANGGSVGDGGNVATSNTFDSGGQSGLSGNGSGGGGGWHEASNEAVAGTGAIDAPLQVGPRGRINPALILHGHSLIVYGGAFEQKNREWAMDDCWTIDLVRRDGWRCVIPGTFKELDLLRADLEDDTEDPECDQSDEEETGSEDLDEDESEDGAGDEGDGNTSPVNGAAEDVAQNESELASAAASMDVSDEDGESADEASPQKRRNRKRRTMSVREEIRELQARLRVDDAMTTPLANEALREFFSRTATHWAALAVKEAAETEESLDEKELRRKAFLLAEARYETLRPTLRRLNELERAQREGEGTAEPRAALTPHRSGQNPRKYVTW